jgi:SAM-dependent methyltransferase
MTHTAARDAAAALAGPDVETSSDAYARRFAGPVGAYFLERQAEVTLALLAPWPRARVLDVGGGHGQLVGPLAEAGYEVTVLGSDPSCRRRVACWVDAGRARFTAGDLTRLPSADGAFDVALAFRLLPHVDDWQALVAELCRIARRGVVVDYPTRRSVNAVAEPLFGLKKGVEGDTRPFRVFDDGAVADAFSAAGFLVTARRPEFVLPMALHRAVGKAPLSRATEGALAALGLRRLLGSPVVLRAERRV